MMKKKMVLFELFGFVVKMKKMEAIVEVVEYLIMMVILMNFEKLDWK